jgi:hypothetical protein
VSGRATLNGQVRNPGGQLGAMLIENCQQLLVVDIPKSAPGLYLAEKPKVCHELSKPDIVRKLAQLGQYGQSLALRAGCHGNKSPIFWSLPIARRSLPYTSTRTSVPGDNIAIRVALVTPL